MKVKILKKSIKEGTTEGGKEYSIKSLYVSFTESDVYSAIVEHLKKMGATSDKIEKFCKPSEYNGNVSYGFGLGCSHFTFDKVERFGVLDAKIIFSINDAGFINAKIQVVDKKEQVLSYDSPEDFVSGWECGNTPEKPIEKIVVPDLSGIKDIPDFLKPEIPEDNGLPF